MMVKIHLYSDPAHGWLKVSYNDLAKHGLLGAISGYSYMRGKDYFLEEDSDAGMYLQKLKQKGIQYEIVEHTSNKSSKIRNYARVQW